MSTQCRRSVQRLLSDPLSNPLSGRFERAIEKPNEKPMEPVHSTHCGRLHQLQRLIGMDHLLRPGFELGDIGAQNFLFHSQNLRGVHGKTPQPQAQQQARHVGIPGHLPAHTHPFTSGMASLNGALNEPQHRGVQGVVQMRNRLIGSVNRQGCLLYTSPSPRDS